MRHFVSVRVTKHGKFRKTHIAEINAPTEAEALRHLENRCKPGGEFARKFPGATFAEFQVTPLYGKPVVPRERVVNRDAIDVTPIREARERLVERLRAIEPLRAAELLYSTTDPYETPLVMPAWAREIAAIAKQIDDGYDLRRAAGLPVDGSLPDDWERRFWLNAESCS